MKAVDVVFRKTSIPLEEASIINKNILPLDQQSLYARDTKDKLANSMAALEPEEENVASAGSLNTVLLHTLLYQILS